ncbi:MAG: hypothetical protein LBI36_01165 [Oscillospiraceae bacterium]|jgi:hypothetical protein|nr:hypothetical protein [Oscillospiraceae bacterium]
MDLRTFFVFAETLLKNERELKELRKQLQQIDEEVETAEKEIPALSVSVKRQIGRIKEEAKKSVAVFEGKVNYDDLRGWITANMASFDRTYAPVLQALMDDTYSSVDRASVLATMYPEIFAKFLETMLNSPIPLTDAINEKNDMVRRQIEFEKKINQLSLTKTGLAKRIPKVEGAYNFPLKQILEIVSLQELEAWESVMPLIKKLKIAAAAAAEKSENAPAPAEPLENAIPVQAVPVQAIPVNSAPAQAVPMQAIPMDAVPAEVV